MWSQNEFSKPGGESTSSHRNYISVLLLYHRLRNPVTTQSRSQQLRLGETYCSFRGTTKHTPVSPVGQRCRKFWGRQGKRRDVESQAMDSWKLCCRGNRVRVRGNGCLELKGHNQAVLIMIWKRGSHWPLQKADTGLDLHLIIKSNGMIQLSIKKQ